MNILVKILRMIAALPLEMTHLQVSIFKKKTAQNIYTKY